MDQVGEFLRGSSLGGVWVVTRVNQDYCNRSIAGLEKRVPGETRRGPYFSFQQATCRAVFFFLLLPAINMAE